MDSKKTKTVFEKSALESAENNQESAMRYAYLSTRLFPRFPEETCVSAAKMEFIFQGIAGLVGVVRLLNRSGQLREEQADFGKKKARPLCPLDEEHLWCAAIALSRSLKQTVDDLYDDAC